MHISHRPHVDRSHAPDTLIGSSGGFVTIRPAGGSARQPADNETSHGTLARSVALGAGTSISAPILATADARAAKTIDDSTKASEPCSCGMQNGNRLLTTVEAARYLRVSVQWLEKMRVYGLKNGTPPPHVRLGRFVKYRLSDLDAYIERNLARSTSEYAHSAH